MRNVAAINRLADFIENGRYAFDMEAGWADPHCGTAGCIGGHAAVLWKTIRDTDWGFEAFGFSEGALAEKLGITLGAVDNLCYPFPLKHISRSIAVAALRRLAKTGRVKFSRKDDPSNATGATP